MNPFIGEVKMCSFNFAPRNWAQCNGQSLPINQNQALFSLLGTMYGGNGTTTFNLPNLQGRVPVHFGSQLQLGQAGGAATVTLTSAQLPVHAHGTAAVLPVSSLPATETEPAGHVFAVPTDGSFAYAPTTDVNLGGAEASAPSQGGGQAHDNMQPYLCINYCIALQGIFPSIN